MPRWLLIVASLVIPRDTYPSDSNVFRASVIVATKGYGLVDGGFGPVRPNAIYRKLRKQNDPTYGEVNINGTIDTSVNIVRRTTATGFGPEAIGAQMDAIAITDEARRHVQVFINKLDDMDELFLGMAKKASVTDADLERVRSLKDEVHVFKIRY
ncbi:MAG: hypothetical protein LQ340_005476 [Diploschistes diacapsis]|nr:MAG: hypothetical protein LQ340_005476 [Diploschistes diacapsis]